MIEAVCPKITWVINQYGSLPNTGMPGRPVHLSRELTKLGHKVTLISARWSHLTRDTLAADAAPEIERYEGFRILRIPVVKYHAAHDKRRIVNWLYFALKLLGIGAKLNEKPDVIIYSSPSLVGVLSAYRLAKKYNAKLVFEVRDIWPLTPMKLGGYSSKHPFIILLQWIEDFAYRKSDHVISNLEGVLEHIKNRGMVKKNFTWIPNGISLDELQLSGVADENILSSIRDQPFSVTYVGTIGLANSLDTLIDAAGLIQDKYNIHINIIGEGDLLGTLKSKATSLGLRNVHFWGAVPKDQVHCILRASDSCVICWKKAFLYRYGVAANKIFDYLYAGKPIIHAYSGRYDLVSRYKAGITVPAEDVSALSQAIRNLAGMNEGEREKMGKSGLQAVKKNHEYAIIAKTLSNVICSHLVID